MRRARSYEPASALLAAALVSLILCAVPPTAGAAVRTCTGDLEATLCEEKIPANVTGTFTWDYNSYARRVLAHTLNDEPLRRRKRGKRIVFTGPKIKLVVQLGGRRLVAKNLGMRSVILDWELPFR